jgi:hypothetical protein
MHETLLIQLVVLFGMGGSLIAFPKRISRSLTNFYAKHLPRPFVVHHLSMSLAGVIMILLGVSWVVWRWRVIA